MNLAGLVPSDVRGQPRGASVSAGPSNQGFPHPASREPGRSQRSAPHWWVCAGPGLALGPPFPTHSGVGGWGRGRDI